MYGTPGPVYLDFPGSVLTSTCSEDEIKTYDYVEDIPRTFADPTCIAKAFDVLKGSKNPLVIVGKGITYSDASEEMRVFIEDTKLPFLPTPMAKGTLPDDHPQFVGSARSLALKDADVIVLACARLNWILHFGHPPRFRKDVKIIQIENDSSEFHQNVRSEVILYGD